MKGFKDKDNKFHPTENSNHGSINPEDAKSNGSTNDGVDHTGAKELKDKKTMKEFISSGKYLEDEVRRRADKGSPHFFDADAVKFFSSRLSELMWSEGELQDYQRESIYFITSEQDRGHVEHSGSTRAFTVRKIDVGGDITKVGDFQGYPTLNEARKAVKEALQ